ncbi:hypothetical protein L1987_37237 [Smallanthus sonchifolius]|uniref:Uncharacterized protein n=1 Tax=Smallanthus sonchifolius TaxID=185202 RepID=A0ACB9HH63_9ASTR|nr:hypothetical protein L1987_37237 [Smallanthus sonchifolius]
MAAGGHGLSVVPPQLWEISDITKVDLSRNSIEDLPIQLSSCASLECEAVSDAMISATICQVKSHREDTKLHHFLIGGLFRHLIVKMRRTLTGGIMSSDYYWPSKYSWGQRSSDYSRSDDDYGPMEDLTNNNSLSPYDKLGIQQYGR